MTRFLAVGAQRSDRRVDRAFVVLAQARARRKARRRQQVAGGVVDAFGDRAQRVDRKAQALIRIVGEAGDLVVGVAAQRLDRCVNRQLSVRTWVPRAGAGRSARHDDIAHRVVGVLAHRARRIDGEAQTIGGVVD